MKKAKIDNKEKFFHTQEIYELLTRFEIAIDQGEELQASFIMHRLKRDHNLKLTVATFSRTQTFENKVTNNINNNIV